MTVLITGGAGSIGSHAELAVLRAVLRWSAGGFSSTRTKKPVPESGYTDAICEHGVAGKFYANLIMK
jgi:nucleoside-diphosphate-sugar epimerase